MRKRTNSVLILIIVALLVMVIFLKPSYGWRLREFFAPRAPWGASLQADNPSVLAQNAALSAELAKLESVRAELPVRPANYIRAMVYSRYPMNFKNELLVDAGAGAGVAAGKAVVFQGIVIGSVEKVFSDSALVRTVFDGGFKMPVRIGPAGYDALFTGGSYPKAASVEKKARIAPGNAVYAAARGFPYGLPVAEIDATSTSADNLFQEASLKFAYDINTIQTVLIER